MVALLGAAGAADRKNEDWGALSFLGATQKILRNSDDRFKNNKTFRVVKIISSEPKNTKVRCDATSLGLDQIQIIWLERTQTREEAETARTWQRKTMDCVKTSWFSGAKYFQLCLNILSCFEIFTDFFYILSCFEILQIFWNICSSVEIFAAVLKYVRLENWNNSLLHNRLS